MDWTTITWSAGAGVCLALAGVHLLVWVKSPKAWANLFFAIAAGSAAATAIFELSMMHAPTPEAYGELLRWNYVPVALMLVSLVWFVRFYLRAGRIWLIWLLCALRALIVGLNFMTDHSLHFREITGLHQVHFLGEIVVLPVGVQNPWFHLANAGTILLIIITIDAAIAAWRMGNRHRAVAVGSTIIGATVLGIMMSFMLAAGMLPMPYTLSLVFLIIVLGMGYELSINMINAGQLSEALHQSRERMRLAAHAANLGLWEWDVGRDELWVNDVTRARLGAQNGERLDLDRFLQSVHPEDREATRRAIGHALDRGEELRVEYRMVVPGGHVRWMGAGGRVERGLNHKPLRLRGITMDITDRIHSHTEKIQLRKELAHLNRVLTMNELSASLAHEINQPLGAILNNASAAQILNAKHKAGHPEVEEILTDIITDAMRAGEVVRNIRGIVKKEEVIAEPLDLNLLIRGAVDLYRNVFSLEKISVFMELQPDLAPVSGDRVRLQQVIMNLVSNASDAMRKSATKALTIRSSMQSSDVVIVSVSDSGTGIADTLKDRLFEPFFSSKKDGLGMGLRICRSIIEEHGGRIWAENNPTPGATFYITLNAHRGESQ